MAECNRLVSSGGVAYPCFIDVNHDGPCAAREIPRSVRQRQDWLDKQRTAQRVVERIPTHQVEELGMQGEPIPVGAGLFGKNDPEGHRVHPAEARRRLRIERGEEDDFEPLENQLVSKAGGVDISRVGTTKDPRYAIYEERQARAPGSEWKTSHPIEEAVPPIVSAVDHESGVIHHVDGEGNVYRDPLPTPTKQRPGDQPLPTKNDQPFIQDLLIDDIERRKAVGIERYGTPLQPFNDRNVVQDAFEEALDLATYLRQLLFERVEVADLVLTLVHNLPPYDVTKDQEFLDALERLGRYYGVIE